MTTNLAIATGRRLRAARLSAGMRADDAARRASLEPGAVSALERGATMPYLDDLRRLADVYGKSLDDLAGRA